MNTNVAEFSNNNVFKIGNSFKLLPSLLKLYIII